MLDAVDGIGGWLVQPTQERTQRAAATGVRRMSPIRTDQADQVQRLKSFPCAARSSVGDSRVAFPVFRRQVEVYAVAQSGQVPDWFPNASTWPA